MCFGPAINAVYFPDNGGNTLGLTLSLAVTHTDMRLVCDNSVTVWYLAEKDKLATIYSSIWASLLIPLFPLNFLSCCIRCYVSAFNSFQQSTLHFCRPSPLLLSLPRALYFWFMGPECFCLSCLSQILSASLIFVSLRLDSPWKVYLSEVDPAVTAVSVGGLTPARTYQFRLCAVNQVGRGQYSAETQR